MTSTTLFRPVGINELKLIVRSKYSEFPPRLDWQPIFYPVTNYEYAEEIASKWNTKHPSYAGFVTQFDVDSAYLSRFEIQNVGGSHHNELWVPAEELAEFNRHIQGEIKILTAYFGKQFQGETDLAKLLAELNRSE